MSAHLQGSGPRSNAYSESKFTHWAIYDPFFAEAVTAYKRFDDRLSKSPRFPHIISLGPLAGFIHPCSRDQVAQRLSQMPSAHIAGLRAVFMLAGRRKQERSWTGDSSSSSATNEVTAPDAAITFRLHTARQWRGTGEFCR